MAVSLVTIIVMASEIIITVSTSTNYCIRWRNLFSSLRRFMELVMSPMTMLLLELSCRFAPGAAVVPGATVAGGGGGITAPSCVVWAGDLFCLAPVVSGDITELLLQLWHCWTYSRVRW